MRRPPRALVTLAWAAIGFNLGYIVDHLLPEATRKFGPGPVELTALERSGPLEQTLIPMDIWLRIMPHAEFQAHSHTAAAFTYFWRSRCEIVIPDDMTIVALPAAGFADWKERDWTGDILAHEILHCLRGKWHP